MKLSVRKRLFLSHFVAVVLVSGSIGTYFYRSARDSLLRSLQARLQNTAALAGEVIEVKNLDGIRSAADVESEAYLTYLRLLRSFRHSNSDIAFLYLMRREGDQVTFVVDSDETEAQAKPGQVYREVVPSLLRGFTEPSVDGEIVTDKWGSFLSGYAPVKNGHGHYLVGLDMRADEVKRKFYYLQVSGFLSLLLSIVLAYLFSRILSARFVQSIGALTARCRDIASGKLEQRMDLITGDEFDELIGAFNHMSADLSAARSGIERANRELEQRVQGRTRDLQAALDRVKVLSGLVPICASCKKIREDSGYWTQVERFVERHSDAQFTHGICPECMARMYPDAAPPA